MSELINVSCNGQCPICGSENLDYKCLEIADGDMVFYPFICNDCNFQGRENYELSYIDTTNNI